MKRGLLLVNLGTPNDASIVAVRRYLREFLADARVISLPAPLRYLLLYCFILPFRTRRTAKAYQSIWSDQGSPLLCNSLALLEKLQHHLGDECKVSLGMRYGNPSLKQALNELKGCEEITILPLYPQYSSAATGSSIEKIFHLIETAEIFPTVHVIRDFHAHPRYIEAQAALIKPFVSQHEHILFSYHGVPEQHLQKMGCDPICQSHCPSTLHHDIGCYRAQCMQTSSLIAQALGLESHQWITAFQSRLGKTPWIKPYTDDILIDLRSRGITRIAVSCPSFVSDCLETLEEIGIRLQQQWLKLGGEKLTLIPCLNDSEHWVTALLNIAHPQPLR